jgi:hypothetical protein
VTYSLLAVVGRDLGAELPAGAGATVLDLPQGIQLVRISEDAHSDHMAGSYAVTPRMLSAIRTLLPGPPARAMLEALFWAGVGHQFACAWSGGDTVLEPIGTSHDLDDPPGAILGDGPGVVGGAPWAIDQALRAIGVVADDNEDEFSTLGLNEDRIRWRSDTDVSLDWSIR